MLKSTKKKLIKEIRQAAISEATRDIYDTVKVYQFNGAIIADANTLFQYLSTHEGGGVPYEYVDNKVAQETTRATEIETQLRNDLTNKLDKVTTTTTYDQVYCKLPNGTQGMYSMSAELANGVVVKRNGNQIKCATPVSDNDAASKGYVDTQVATEATARSTADTNQLNAINANATAITNLQTQVTNEISRATTAENNRLDKQTNLQTLWTGTQAEYDALTKSSTTLYFIKE